MKHRQLTFKQYRSTDLVFLTALFTIFEYIVTLAATKWFPGQPYVFSLSSLFIVLILMRWNLYAVIPAIAGAISYCIASKAGYQHYFIYITGNLTALLSYIYIRFRGKDNVRRDPIRSAVFVILTFLFMQAGRSAVSLAFGGELKTFILFITTDSLSLLFALIALIPLRRADGLFEDQKSYLFRIEKEKNESNTFQ